MARPVYAVDCRIVGFERYDWDGAFLMNRAAENYVQLRGVEGTHSFVPDQYLLCVGGRQ